MKDTARIITTFKCSRKCRYCANKSGHIRQARRINFDGLSALSEFDFICITGGEPMEFVDDTISVIRRLKEVKNFTIYLYTARYTPRIGEVIQLVDGIHFTIHEGAGWKDFRDFYSFQSLIKRHRNKSFRLYISQDIARMISIRPNLWRRVEVKPFQVDCPLPDREILYILEK